MAQNEDTVAVARAIYEQMQDRALSETLLCGMAQWVETGHAPLAAEIENDTLSNPERMQVARRAFIRTWGFSIPCQEAVDALLDLSPLVEIGAGTGYWSAMLRAAGADVVATDAQTSGRQVHYGFDCAIHSEVLALDAVAAVLRFPERNVFCSWPAKDTPWDADAARALAPGRYLALIAPEAGGIAGTDDLFALLHEGFRHIADVAMPCFPGVQDSLSIHQRF